MNSKTLVWELMVAALISFVRFCRKFSILLWFKDPRLSVCTKSKKDCNWLTVGAAKYAKHNFRTNIRSKKYATKKDKEKKQSEPKSSPQKMEKTL